MTKKSQIPDSTHQGSVVIDQFITLVNT